MRFPGVSVTFLNHMTSLVSESFAHNGSFSHAFRMFITLSLFDITKISPIVMNKFYNVYEHWISVKSEQHRLKLYTHRQQ